MSEEFCIFAPQFRTEKVMENVTISFDVPSTGIYTVKELTERARRFVSELVEPVAEMPSDDEIDVAIGHAIPMRTAEEEQAELDRRMDDLLAGRAKTIAHENILNRVMAAL